MDPEPQRDVAPAPTAPALNLLFVMSGLSKMSDNYDCFLLFPVQFYTRRNQEKSGVKMAPTQLFTFACYKKLAWYIAG
jgi:hypothetical protein